MKIYRVIGKVVLNRSVYEGKAGRWLLVQPVDREGLANPREARMNGNPTEVTFDELGAREGDLVVVATGGEATLPFDVPYPVDRYNTAILDQINYQPT